MHVLNSCAFEMQGTERWVEQSTLSQTPGS
jgi:hypothetical protein